MSSDLHRRTSHHSPYSTSTEAPEPADRLTTDLAMASSVDDERPTAVDVQRLSTLWENRGTIHVMGDNTNQSDAAVPEPTSIEPPSSAGTKKSHFWQSNLASILPDSRPKHERTESSESTASGSSQGSSGSSTVVDEKVFEVGGGNKAENKGSATASVNEIEDITIINNNDDNSRQPPEEAAYHVFTKKEKWLVTVIIALAGLFSPLSSNIYFPALGAIANVSQLYTHP